MDRGTKLMFGMLTAAVCLMVIMMISREAPQAHADMYRGDTGGEPTIVWYDIQLVSEGGSYTTYILARAWSDGTIEVRKQQIYRQNELNCFIEERFCSPWLVVSSPNEGLAALSDLNDDESVNIDDLLQVINDWGPAPPNVIPPSDCPLAMINP